MLGLGFLSRSAAGWLRVPHSVLLVVLGLTGGWLYHQTSNPLTAEVASLFPEVVLFLLLPPLIFESAYHLSYEDLRRDLLPVSALAVGGLLLSAAAIALGLTWLGLPPRAAWLFGALISATDPVAVVALVRSLGAPRRLAILLEGESLLNDGTAIVLFRVLLAGAAGLPQAAWQFLVVVAGGIVLGLVFSWAFRLLFWMTSRSGLAQAGLTIVAAYSSFIVADHSLHVSGVICTMVVGLTLGKQARLTLNRETLGAMHSIWELLALTANSLVFLAVGLSAERVDLAALGVLIPLTLALVLVARAAAVFTTVGILNRLGWSQPISLAYQVLLTWGGLRGGLALALVLTLPVQFPYRNQMLVLATAVVLCSLLLNAMTTGPLIRWLKLDRLTEREELFYRRGLRQGVRQVFAGLQRGVASGALSGQLLQELEESCLEELEQGNEDAETEEAFDLYQLLLAEQQLYNAELEEGRLSARAYLSLRRAVETRLSVLQLQGPEALQQFDFRLELPEVPRWSHLQARQELERLAHELEVLLHLDLVTSQLEALPHLQPAAHKTLASWSAATSQRLSELQVAYPDLSLAVQSLFVARAIETSAQAALDELHEAELIGPAVQARARQTVERLVAQVTQESARFLKEPDLRRSELFEGLPAEELARLQAATSFRRIEAGATVYREGEPADALYLVISGLLEVRSTRFRSLEQHPRLFPGSFFGELSLLYDRPRTATVTSLVTSNLARLDRETLEELMERRPEVRRRLEEEAASRLEHDARLERGSGGAGPPQRAGRVAGEQESPTSPIVAADGPG